MNPGVTVLPGRSRTRVPGPTSGSTSASVPTATMTPFRTATACATVSWRSTVMTLARRTTRSAASPPPVTPPHPPARRGSPGAAGSPPPGRRIVLEVVAGALEAGRRGEEREDGVAVGGPRVVLRAVDVHEALDRGERGLVGGEPGVLDRALLPELLGGLRGGGEVTPEQAAGERPHH